MLNKIGKKLGYKNDGFTIIEVMIVLAVAGLIMAIVLIAIPQLQRNQRNTARKDVTNRIKTEIDGYAGNNNGRIPQDQGEIDDVYTRYLGCDTGATILGGDCEVNIEGPSSGIKTPTFLGTETTFGTTPTFGGVTFGGETLEYDFIMYQSEVSCDGEDLIDESGNIRVYAMWAQLEGGAFYCIDNR